MNLMDDFRCHESGVYVSDGHFPLQPRGHISLCVGLCILLLTGCDRGTPTETELDPVIDLITVVSGDSQFGRTGEVLADPVVVRVADRGGDPIATAAVVFAITNGGGALSRDSVETDRDGLAWTDWTLGRGPEHAIEVRPVDVWSRADPVVFTATNELTLEIEVVSGADQVALRGEILPEPVTVRLESCYGDTMAGIDVGFEVVRGGGSVAEANVTSNDVGMAEVSWSLGKGPDNRVQVTVLDDSFAAIPAVVQARTQLELVLAWISDVAFYDHNGARVDHDNRVLESDHFLIFSDADSDSAKTNMAKHTERYLAELLQDFEIPAVVDIGIVPADRTTKITVYSMREPREHGQVAFPYGFFHAGFDSDPYLHWGIHNERFFNSIKHETTHVLNFLVTGNRLNGQHWWFTEGIAEYASGGGEPQPHRDTEVPSRPSYPGC